MGRKTRDFAGWEKEFWGMNPGRRDLAIVIREGYVLVEYASSPPPSVPYWWPTRMVQPPDVPRHSASEKGKP